ncbi:MAG TPA: hypothetical protein VLB73_03865 [Patescibacteria group bacterium]|nr:hypothetical protein [Patescibacteria group bacterium]
MGRVLDQIRGRSLAGWLSTMNPREANQQAKKEKLSRADRRRIRQCAHAKVYQECLESRNPLQLIRRWGHYWQSGLGHNPGAGSYEDPRLK